MKHNKTIITILVTLVLILINTSIAFAMFPGTPSQEPDPKVYNTVVVREFPNNNCKCEIHKQTILVRPCYHCQPGGLLKWQEAQPEWPGVTPVPGPDAYIYESCGKSAPWQSLDNIRCHINHIVSGHVVSHKTVDSVGEIFNIDVKDGTQRPGVTKRNTSNWNGTDGDVEVIAALLDKLF